MNVTTLQKLAPVQIARDLAEGTGASIYLVGGAVRDSLLAPVLSGDCDFAIADGFDAIVAAFTRRIRGHAIAWDLDQTRVVYRERDGKQVSVDLARLRAADIAGDLQLRDFTINAMAVAVAGLFGQAGPDLIDPLGGKADLANKLIRICAPQAFDDDPLRMLRAIRFARQLGFDIDTATIALLSKKHGLITKTSIERIKKELFTLFGLPRPSLSIRQMLQAGLLGCLLPETLSWQGFRQSPPHQFDLLEHSLKTVEHLERLLKTSSLMPQPCLDEVLEEGVTRRSLLFFSAFLHDSGKPSAARGNSTRRSFHGHDQEGAKINRAAAERLGLGRRCRRMAEGITRNHMRLLQLSHLETVTDRAKLRFLADCGPVAVEVLLLSMADMMATSAAPAYQAQLETACALGQELLARAADTATSKSNAPLLTGADIINELGIAPGPEVGRILAELHLAERQGTVTNRDTALAWLRARRN